jgi:hypothetical protein
LAEEMGEFAQNIRLRHNVTQSELRREDTVTMIGFPKTQKPCDFYNY